MGQYTKSGFSKSFSCCGRWDECQMGKALHLCYFKEKDSQTMKSCSIYRRNKKKEDELVLFEEALFLIDQKLEL